MLELIYRDEVDSSNAEAKRLVGSGRPPGFAVSSPSQTAGRGRFNRVWQTLTGNLAITIVVSPSTPIARRPTIALINGLALYDVVKPYASGSHVLTIKWPNDVLIDGAKISGTLIETDVEAIYVGIGVNVATKPQGMPYPVVALSEIAHVDVAVLTRQLLDTWMDYFELWDRQGFQPLITRYNARLYRVEERITFALDRDKSDWISGTCLGVSLEGQLLIRDDEGRITAHSAGDVDIPH